MINRILHAGVLTILAALVAVPLNAAAQASRTRSATHPATSLLASLPESDAVALVKVKRALDEAMPRLLASNPAKLAAANAQIDQFKERTGIDPRGFDEVAFAANGKYREEKRQGKTIYIFNLDQEIRLFGLINFKVGEFAASPLDSNTLAIGDPASVRNVIDVNRGRKRASAELVALASRDPEAIAGFGGNISPALLQSLDIGNQAIAQDLSTIRQVYGSVVVSETNVEMFFAARTTNAEAAKNLGDTLEGLKQLGALFVTRLPAAKSTLAKSALNNLKITIQANELQVRTAVAQSAIAPLMGGL